MHASKALTALLMVTWQVLMEQYDTNHDGQIDYPEFLAMMRANNEELVAASTYLRRRSSTMT